MKTINFLALVAFVITLTAYFMSAGTASVPAETGGDRTVMDLLPTRRRAAPVIISPRPEPKKTAELNPLLEAVKAGDICAIDAIKKKKNYNTDQQDFAALAALIDPSPELAEFLSLSGPVLATSAPAKKFKSRAARLTWAMRLTGAGSLASLPEDLPGARKLLLELESEDPGNAALPFLRLGIEKRMKLEPSVMAETEAKIAAGSDFHYYFNELNEELQRASWLNPAVHRLMDYIGYYVLTEPSLYEGRSALSTSTTLSPGDIPRIAEVMKGRALRMELPIQSRSFDAEIYENGRALENKPGTPSIYDLSAEAAQARGVEMINFPSPVTNDGCDSRSYEEYFYSRRAAY